jgi:hypothetical protein
MASYRPLRKLADLTTVSLALTAVLLVVAPIATIVHTRQLLATIRSPQLSYADLDRLTDSGGIAPLLYQILEVLLLGSFGLFIAWLYRARRNLDGFEEARPKWGWGWTFAAWLIPVVNLLAPPAVVADVARESRRAATAHASRVGWLVWLGWLALLSTVGYGIMLSVRPVETMSVGWFTYSTSEPVDPSVREQFAAAYTVDGPGPLELGALGLLAVVALAGLVVVRLVTAAQEELNSRA